MAKQYNDKRRIIIECNRAAEDSLIPLLEQLQAMGDMGASRTIKIEDWSDEKQDSFGFDGDGADHIERIIVEDRQV